MQSVAGWLVARPQNAVLALAATLLLPVLQVVSGAIMVLLVLRHGMRMAVIEGLAAGAVLTVVAMIVSAPVAQIATSIITTLLPALLLGLLLAATRSITLTVQVAVILAVVALLGFQLAAGDLVAYWEPAMSQVVDWARSNGLQEQAELLARQPAMAANMMTIAAVLTGWTLYAIYLFLGYRLFEVVSGKSGQYGRFCDLNLGRVIAVLMALASVIAFLSGAAWLQNIAVVLFAMFWLQGLAVVHWMHAQGQLPVFVVIATYALLVVLHVFVLLTLAVVGYMDAWFGFRRRATGQGKN